jgi:hypothetical protein
MPKVFEVVYEGYPRDSNKLTEAREYVTSEEDTLQSVAYYFTGWCLQNECELKMVREVLTVVRHIEREGSE